MANETTLKYIVIEIQTDASNNVATLTWQYDTRDEAESKFHAVLTAAAISALPKHAAVMMTEEGFFLKRECYVHEAE